MFSPVHPPAVSTVMCKLALVSVSLGNSCQLLVPNLRKIENYLRNIFCFKIVVTICLMFAAGGCGPGLPLLSSPLASLARNLMNSDMMISI